MKGMKLVKIIKMLLTTEQANTQYKRKLNFIHLFARFEAFLYERLHMSVLDIDNSKRRPQTNL